MREYHREASRSHENGMTDTSCDQGFEGEGCRGTAFLLLSVTLTLILHLNLLFSAS